MNGFRALVKGFDSKIEFQSALVRTEIVNHWIIDRACRFNLRNRLLCNNIDVKGSFEGNMIYMEEYFLDHDRGSQMVDFALIRKSLLLKLREQ